MLENENQKYQDYIASLPPYLGGFRRASKLRSVHSREPSCLAVYYEKPH